MKYREMSLEEAEKIKDIDATYFVKNAWRNINGKLSLVEINWTDYELPNGLQLHMEHFIRTIQKGGFAFGCFDNDILVGYATLNAEMFGKKSKYVLLDQLFISKDYRNKRIGKQLINLCVEQARVWGANKIYICAGSSEDTVAFYKKIGCVNVTEVNQELFEEDMNDIQLELEVI